MEARTTLVKLYLAGFWTGENTRTVSFEPIYTHKLPTGRTMTMRSESDFRGVTFHNSSSSTRPASWYEDHLMQEFNRLNIDFDSLGFDFDKRRLFVHEIVYYYLFTESMLGLNAGFHVQATLEFVKEYEFDVRQMSIQHYLYENRGTSYDEEGVMVMDEVGLTARRDDLNVRTNDDEEGVLVMNEVQAVPSSAVGLTGPISKLVECENFKGSTCPICLDDFCRAMGVLKTPCGHLFHDGCITRWLQTKDTCPMCRKIIA